MQRALYGAAATFLLLGACTVPSLDSLGEKQCDVDAGRTCISPYQCLSGFCRLPGGGDCKPGTREACGKDAGECVLGQRVCGDDSKWSICVGDTAPTTELCDGLDNDCNGAVDNDVPLSTDSCESIIGVCLNARRACVDGGYETPCTRASYGQFYEPSELSCDGRDNDCDGTPDDSVTGGACVDAGVCAGRQKSCSGGAPGACAAPGFEATEATCDGKDNDCDGVTDEGPSGGPLRSAVACALTQGVCAGALKACVDGGFEASCTAASYGSTYEQVESSCDGLDNDCDGGVDLLADGGVLRGSTCERTLGVCANTRHACTAGAFEPTCTATSYGPLFQDREFLCDGLDNDCDGQPDLSPTIGLSGQTAEHVTIRSIDGGYVALYASNRGAGSRVFFRRFDRALVPVGTEATVNSVAATSATRPAAVRIGANDVLAAWVEDFAGGTRIVATRLDMDGNKSIGGSAGAVLPLLSRSVTPVGDISLSLTKDDANAFVLWVENTPAPRIHGVAFSSDGQTVQAEQTLFVPTDGGTEVPLEVTSVAAGGGTPLIVGWTSILNNDYHVSARVMNVDLTPTANLPTSRIITSQSGQCVPLMPRVASAFADVPMAWVERNPTNSTWAVRAKRDLLLFTDSPVVKVPFSNEPITALDVFGGRSANGVGWAVEKSSGTSILVAPFVSTTPMAIASGLGSVDHLDVATGNAAAFDVDAGVNGSVITGAVFCTP